MKNHSYLVFIFLFLYLFSCSDDEAVSEVTLPENLTVSVSQDDGLVSVSASADKANFYAFFFGDTPNEVPIVAANGKASHQYTADGTYTVVVRAHTSQTHFISTEKTIEITIPVVLPGVPTEGYSTPESYEGMSLVWQDEFDGNNLDLQKWTHETGTGSNGWGNNELQFYRAENTSVHDGLLFIEAKKESYQGASYTSSRIITKGKHAFRYGRIDIRAVLPKGQGIWPALWMLGENIGSVGWPASGEIDIMEMIGGSGREKTVHGTLHWDNSGHVCTCDKPGYSLPSGTFNDKFHVFSIVWTPTAITWYMDDIQFNTINITPDHMTEFHEDFFLIFNLAVGGNWPGYPDDTTILPQHLIVDYVRVFQND